MTVGHNIAEQWTHFLDKNAEFERNWGQQTKQKNEQNVRFSFGLVETIRLELMTSTMST